MKAVIVNCFDTYEDRVDLVHDFFKEHGFEVTVIQSDFRHLNKVKRIEKKNDFIFVESKTYYNNMSVKRMTSHYDFAKSAFQIVEDLFPHLLYVMVPPNSLARFAAQYKRKHQNVKLVFDLIDLWPETMPVGKVKELPPFSFWGAMRNSALKYADYVLVECDLYREVLKKQLIGIRAETLYLAKREAEAFRHPMLSEEEIHLCYLGSINNIIDITKITTLVSEINKIKPVTLHIIGDGESKDILINEVKDTGAIIEYHGKVYDSQQKQEIFDQCQFGLNIMKDTVCVGLTMKSIDYFQAGLPIINSIKADTARLVDKYKIGINAINENLEDVAEKIAKADLEELFVMRENSYKLFDSIFSVEAFNTKLDRVMKEL